MECRITSVEFHQYKALSHFTVKLEHVNILVGSNNAGKSTIVGAFRILSVGLRRAKKQRPSIIYVMDEHRHGYHLTEESIPVSLENVHTELQDTETTIKFRLSNGNRLVLLFPIEGGCVLYGEADGRSLSTAAQFNKQFPITVTVVPVLGPVEHAEQLVSNETVQRNITTHRASRNFRSYWYHNPREFENFAELVNSTWPGMEITRPEIIATIPAGVSMFCKELGRTRELYWSGFGFQAWCQILAHVSRATTSTIIVVDEPEIYLHADVQRRLVCLLRDLGPDVLVATHSSEIVADAEPNELVFVDKTRRSGQRLKSAVDTQHALDRLGSAHNTMLTQLARTRRVLFLEGVTDFRTLRRFAKKMGFADLSDGSDIVPVELGGFSKLEDVKVFANGLERVLGDKLLLGAIFDRDYRTPEQSQAIANDLAGHVQMAWIHPRKEMENYLLVPSAIQRATVQESRGKVDEADVDVHTMIHEIADTCRIDTFSQLLKNYKEFVGPTKKDESTLNKEFTIWFESMWKTTNGRLVLAPGKEVLRKLRSTLDDKFGVSLSDARIISAMHRNEIPNDIETLIARMERFRTISPPKKGQRGASPARS